MEHLRRGSPAPLRLTRQHGPDEKSRQRDREDRPKLEHGGQGSACVSRLYDALHRLKRLVSRTRANDPDRHQARQSEEQAGDESQPTPGRDQGHVRNLLLPNPIASRLDDDLHRSASLERDLHRLRGLRQREAVRDEVRERHALVVAGEQRQRSRIRAGVLAPDSEQGQIAPAEDRRVERDWAEIDKCTDLDQRAAVPERLDRGQERLRNAAPSGGS